MSARGGVGLPELSAGVSLLNKHAGGKAYERRRRRRRRAAGSLGILEVGTGDVSVRTTKCCITTPDEECR